LDRVTIKIFKSPYFVISFASQNYIIVIRKSWQTIWKIAFLLLCDHDL